MALKNSPIRNNAAATGPAAVPPAMPFRRRRPTSMASYQPVIGIAFAGFALISMPLHENRGETSPRWFSDIGATCPDLLYALANWR
jgi:hypothetical protein